MTTDNVIEFTPRNPIAETEKAMADAERQAAEWAASTSTDEEIWDLCCARSADFFLRQAGYMALRMRGYAMPPFLPVRGESLPEKTA